MTPDNIANSINDTICVKTFMTENVVDMTKARYARRGRLKDAINSQAKQIDAIEKKVQYEKNSICCENSTCIGENANNIDETIAPVRLRYFEANLYVKKTDNTPNNTEGAPSMNGECPK